MQENVFRLISELDCARNTLRSSHYFLTTVSAGYQLLHGKKTPMVYTSRQICPGGIPGGIFEAKGLIKGVCLGGCGQVVVWNQSSHDWKPT